MNCGTLACGLVVAGAMCAGASADTVYNAADNFSASSNPNGVWSFGQRATIAGAFTTFGTNGVAAGVDYWAAGGSGVNFDLPGAFHNGTGVAIPTWLTTVNMPVNALNLHPGAAGEYSVARFTAPVAGTYSFSAIFEALARDGTLPPGFSTTSDVHLIKNGSELFGADFTPSLGGTVSSGLFSSALAASDIVEVLVGRGPNGTYYSDSTGVDFTVTLVTVPLPPAAYAGLTMLAGVAGLGVIRRRANRA